MRLRLTRPEKSRIVILDRAPAFVDIDQWKMEISYGTYNDDCLVNLMGRGDNLAFAALYERYSSQLLNYAISIIGNKEAAADILQEIFVSLWHRREAISFTHSLKAWLYQAVRFQAVKFIHQSARKRDFLAALCDLMDNRERCAPDQLMEDQELDYAIKSTINTMPARMREVFVLSREAQLTHREISHKLNIAESTVKKIVQNALRFIREKSFIDYLLLFIFFHFF